MIKKYFHLRVRFVLGVSAFLLAFAVLTVSVMRSATATYVFASPTPAGNAVLGEETPDVEYELPFPGKILPDSPLWALKALRDKVWYKVTANPLKKAELALLFADKRLSSSVTLFESKETGVALSTLSKGEKYLELSVEMEKKARDEGFDTAAFLSRLATASLKHRQVIEERILPMVPEEARPEVVRIEDYSKNSFKSARDGLNNEGLTAPKDPFDGI